MTSAADRTPLEVIQRYLDVLYNQHRLDLVEEMIAPETWRHTPGSLVMLTLPESISRIGAFLEKWPKMRFESSVAIAQGEMVTAIWSAWLQDTEGKDLEIGGIEVFRIIDGKIVEAWNQEPAASYGIWQPSRLQASA